MYCKAAELAAAALLLGACAREPAPPRMERIAILRFEDLGPDFAQQWMGRAFSEVISDELAGVPDTYVVSSNRMHGLDAAAGARPVSAPGISAERTLALLAGANRAGYGQYWVRGGRLEAQLTIEDLAAQRTTRVLTASAGAGDVAGAATSLAHQLSARARPYGTRSEPALQAFVTALEGNGPAAAEDAGRAIAADPDFGPPYRLLAELTLRQQDRAAAVAVLDQALSRPAGPDAAERARLELERATLLHDAAAIEKALATLVKLVPRDPTLWQGLGQSLMSRHAYRESVEAYQKCLEVEPDDAGALNLLGYAAAYAGDLNSGMAALRHYQALRPADANALDSMGDVNLISGRLREAEDFYLQAAKKNPALLADGDWLKAAMARLMSGDVAGADGLAKQYLDARAGARDPALEFRRAEWRWVSGRRTEGYRQMAAFARAAETGPLREIASRAYAELAIWSLALGDRSAAAQMAEKAVALAGPSTAATAGMARFLSQPGAPAAEWATRAERLFANPAQAPLKDLVLAYALLWRGDFRAAAPLLQQRYANANPASDEGLAILLAWTWLETGRAKDAAPLLRFNPVPGPSGGGPFHALYFPRLYYLRGVEAAANGKRDEAKANFRLFLQLSGPDPLMWGEEEKAREGLRN